MIHDVRVLMKKSRATLKLLKSQIDEESFNKEYSALEGSGKNDETWRETSVHRKTLKDLKKRYPEMFSHLDRIMKRLICFLRNRNLIRNPHRK